GAPRSVSGCTCSLGRVPWGLVAGNDDSSVLRVHECTRLQAAEPIELENFLNWSKVDSKQFRVVVLIVDRCELSPRLPCPSPGRKLQLLEAPPTQSAAAEQPRPCPCLPTAVCEFFLLL
ncbi:unnamed protein product, partial [Laminaria digitata]